MCFAEPGYYEDGRFGIRIENVMLVRSAELGNNFGGKGYLGFEHVTFVSAFPAIHKGLKPATSGVTDQWLNHFNHLNQLSAFVKAVG